MTNERDIVERLRRNNTTDLERLEAASEITRLRSELEAAHAALSQMPTEPFRSVGDRVLPLAERIENVAGMWKNERAELEAERERWSPVVGNESNYSVSSHGRVRRETPSDTRGGSSHFVLKNKVNRGGYEYVNMSYNDKVTTKTVHAMVMSAFVGPKPEGMQVNHKDGYKRNNRLYNLEYVTPKQNAAHARATLPDWSLRGEDNPISKLSEIDVSHIRDSYSRGDVSQSALANEYGVSQTCISAIVRGKSWTNPLAAKAVEGARG